MAQKRRDKAGRHLGSTQYTGPASKTLNIAAAEWLLVRNSDLFLFSLSLLHFDIQT